MRSNTERTIHEPRVIVQDACIDGCRTLSKKIDEAWIKAGKRPDTQMAVESVRVVAICAAVPQ